MRSSSNTNDHLLRLIDMMSELERYLAILYGIAASGTNEAFISTIMRKISIESAMHNYILITLKELIRECHPGRSLMPRLLFRWRVVLRRL
ncbi:hypothetical protein [Vulcanisaeta sp. JCM 14467]|uniref:hypothetical protein n=1 Tax=Vulcanisaeta sp. JCM 14467 TaxID=1295370 RepID=UPI002092815C|nr:hypothetical protein [Vulcanisaeta sp. JCM 14467]